MTRKLSRWLTVLFALGSLSLLWWSVIRTARAELEQPAALNNQAPTALPVSPEQQSIPHRDSQAAPLISFIDNPTAQCYRPEQYTNDCYIQWEYLNVSATSAQYIISMTVSIDNRLRAYYSGFFQSAMYIPQDMYSPGFRVDCGLPGASGDSNLGQAYEWSLHARETGGLTANSTGRVFCPADVIPVTRANLEGPSSGLIGLPHAFTVTIPATTTLPVTYTWTVTGQALITMTGDISDTKTFIWNEAGVKNMAVDVANMFGMVQVTKEITITNPTPTPTPPHTPTATPTSTPASTPVPPGSSGIKLYLPAVPKND